MVTPTPPPSPTPVPARTSAAQPQAPTPTTSTAAGPVTYETLAPVFTQRCGACHGAAAMAGLNVLTYTDLMKGGASGSVITPGDPDASPLIQVQVSAAKHFGVFEPGELEQVIQWIKDGAPEK